jgi:hypothetical protein
MDKKEIEPRDKTNKKEIEIGDKLSRVIIISVICIALVLMAAFG